jgi:hypothetical protein
MRPEMNFVKRAPGVSAHVLVNPCVEYAVYLDGKKGPVELEVDLPTGNYSAAWVDVATGAESRQALRHEGGTKVLVSREFSDGIALKLRKH